VALFTRLYRDALSTKYKNLGVGYCVTYSSTIYVSKKGLAWELTHKHRDRSLQSLAICSHRCSKTISFPKLLKPVFVYIYPDT